ncbi:hypothetical protein P280DRAFT_517289 [Massarina eburnea CBS 473.64]|uniref:Uncharacterized protein n=1 Tax=Massarina eburnea CBS 473.64 TaxID=1395130 RepID=A0A6A6S1V6_9PLEO|nr:hypothetical protein P280DRAFT_517289 [Massarina eburnea CBS 473.64]
MSTWLKSSHASGNPAMSPSCNWDTEGKEYTCWGHRDEKWFVVLKIDVSVGGVVSDEPKPAYVAGWRGRVFLADTVSFTEEKRKLAKSKGRKWGKDSLNSGPSLGYAQSGHDAGRVGEPESGSEAAGVCQYDVEMSQARLEVAQVVRRQGLRCVVLNDNKMLLTVVVASSDIVANTTTLQRSQTHERLLARLEDLHDGNRIRETS